MKWKTHISKDLKNEKYVFFDIIKNFDYLGILIFKERNSLRKIDSDQLGILAVKSFKKPNIFNQYIYANFRKSKASRSFNNAKYLLSKNINTPTPIAFFEEKKQGKIYRSFYFSEYYEYDFTFRELIEKKDIFNDWSRVLEEFTEFIFKVHESQILFRDLSPGNVLIKKIGSHYEFSLIDLNRMSFKHLSWNERLQNFIRLSMTDEMLIIIAQKYAQLSNKNEKETIQFLEDKNHKYILQKKRKQNLKKIIGKK